MRRCFRGFSPSFETDLWPKFCHAYNWEWICLAVTCGLSTASGNGHHQEQCTSVAQIRVHIECLKICPRILIKSVYSGVNDGTNIWCASK
jgi:hypothetical protein